MEIKLDSKLMKAVAGLFLFAISIILMAADGGKLAGAAWSGNIHWLPGLFMMFMAFAMCGAAYLEKFDCKLVTRACLYLLFSIVMLAKKGVAADYFFLGLWAALEGVMLVFDGLKAKEAKANLWFVQVCLGALVILFGFISCFMETKGLKLNPMPGIAFLFAALGMIFPVCADFLPKCELKLKK